MATITEAECKVHRQHTGVSAEGLSVMFPGGFKMIGVEVPDTADDTDIVVINHANHGITTVEFVRGFTHSTTDDIIITEAPTTLASPSTTGQMNITIGGTTDNKKRFFLIGGV